MQVPLSTITGLDAATFSVCLKAFYAALFSLSMPSFERLTSPRIRVRARRGMSQLIANAYVVGHVVAPPHTQLKGDQLRFLCVFLCLRRCTKRSWTRRMHTRTQLKSWYHTPQHKSTPCWIWIDEGTTVA